MRDGISKLILFIRMHFSMLPNPRGFPHHTDLSGTIVPGTLHDIVNATLLHTVPVIRSSYQMSPVQIVDCNTESADLSKCTEGTVAEGSVRLVSARGGSLLIGYRTTPGEGLAGYTIMGRV